MFKLNHGAIHLTLVPATEKRRTFVCNTILVFLIVTVASGLGYEKSSIGLTTLQASQFYQVALVRRKRMADTRTDILLDAPILSNPHHF